jgi:L-ascorbate metabolism protein UlaG (beta-lactamase superfamily)
MNRIKKSISLIMVILVICTGIIGCGTNSSVSSDSSESSTEPSPGTKTASAENSKPAQSSVSSSESSETTSEDLGLKESEPVKIKEGIHIKKYPGDSACFKFETPDGLKIITDPNLMNEIVKPDIVTESHQHEDHTDVSALKGNYELIKTAGNYSIKGINIVGYPGKHNKGDTEVSNNMYVFTIDGIKLAHLGSQGELPDNETLKKIGKVDILFLQGFSDPTLSKSKMTVTECNTIIKALTPKIVIPEHGTSKFGKTISVNFGYPVEYRENGELVVTKSKLDKIKKLTIYDLDRWF